MKKKPIPGSYVVDLVNDIVRHRKRFEPNGWSVFARGVARMNVTENLVRNPQRQNATWDFKTRLTEKHPQVPLVGFLPHLLPHLPLKSKGGEQQAHALKLCVGYDYKSGQETVFIVITFLF